jgi:hypothetical protein
MAVPAQSLQRAFHLESTVGLDRNTCSNTKNLALPAGPASVVVCLRLSNNGVDTLYLHQIVSEQLGVLESSALYTLPVGQSVFYTYALRLNQSTGIVSRWLSEDLLGRRYCQVAWSVVKLGRSLPEAQLSGGSTGSRDRTVKPSVDNLAASGLVCP